MQNQNSNTTMAHALNGVAAALKAAEVENAKSIVAPYLTILANQVSSLVDEGKREIQLFNEYQKLEEDWNSLQRKIDAARVAFRQQVVVLKAQLEQLRKDAQPQKGEWLTFEKSAEIAQMISYLASRKAEDDALAELLAEQEAMRPEHEEAVLFLEMNEERKEARRKAQKGGN